MTDVQSASVTQGPVSPNASSFWIRTHTPLSLRTKIEHLVYIFNDTILRYNKTVYLLIWILHRALSEGHHQTFNVYVWIYPWNPGLIRVWFLLTILPIIFSQQITRIRKISIKGCCLDLRLNSQHYLMKKCTVNSSKNSVLIIRVEG